MSPDREADRFCGLQIDDQLELGRELHWKFADLGAAQQAVDVACYQSSLFGVVRCVRQQAAFIRETF